MKCVKIPPSKKGGRKHSDKCKERRTLMINLTQRNKEKGVLIFPRYQKGAHNSPSLLNEHGDPRFFFSGIC